MTIPFISETYDPRVSFIVERARQRRQNKEELREELIKYGIRSLDLALFGINTVDGEFNLVLGFHKQRKTTFMINVICNIFMSPTPSAKPAIMIDTLESGMQPDRYVEQIVCNMASRKLYTGGHRYDSYCPICNRSECDEFGITPEVLRLATLSDEQEEVVQWAEKEVSKWNLMVFGANPDEGDSRNFANSIKRAEQMVKSGVQIVIVDHLQQYDVGANQYEKQEIAVEGFSSLVAKYNCVVFMLSQISLTSWREAKAGVGSVTAAGGNRSAQEAMTIFETRYTAGTNEMNISIVDSRKAAPLMTQTQLEMRSGMFKPEEQR